MGWQHNFRMDNTAFAGVVVGHSVPLICQLFAASVGGCGNGCFALAPADNADITMIDGYGYHLPDKMKTRKNGTDAKGGYTVFVGVQG